jgi:hypothetical protein
MQEGISVRLSGMDVSRAQLTNLGNTVVFNDPSFPWGVQVRLSGESERPTIIGLVVRSRADEPVSSSVLAQLPLRQIASVAASALLGEGEALYRMLAKPRPPGVRSWPLDHFERVVRVASWARRIGRPGGAGGAVSEFWSVDYRTARRWLSRARELGLDGDRP